MKFRNFLIAVMVIVGFALGVSRYTTPGSMNDPISTPVHTVARGAHAPAATPSDSAQPAPVAQTQPATKNGGIMLYSELTKLLDKQPTPVVSITLLNGTNTAVATVVGYGAVKVTIPDEGGKKDLRDKALQAGVAFGAQEVESNGILKFFADNFITILIFAFILFTLRGAGKAMTKQMGDIKGMGQARTRNAKENKDNIEKLTWDDVAGCDEAVTELKRCVDGLTSAEVYKKFGAKLPTGILLIGPPGTGKTRLATVVASMCNGTFESTSGSDFVEMLVGVGASRVRDMFATGRKNVKETGRPHIIYIDEIDAVGGKRGSGGLNSNSEREQTLNALLVEMDGVVGNEGIILIAATNRVDMLDPALLRPGRLGTHVHVDLPDVVGRSKIFGIHTKKKAPLAADVTLDKLAKISYSYSGAEIADACNRAAFLAAERYDARRKELIAAGTPAEEVEKVVPVEITMDLFDEGLSFARYGDAKPSKQTNMSDREKLNTARHEAGHAVAAAAFPESDPVAKITIMRRSKALGYVQTMPETDTVTLEKRSLVARIVCMMAGRAAQEVYLQTCDSGASSDFQQATNLARAMVMDWGMTDEIGHMYIPRSENGFGGGLPGVGDELANKVDSVTSKLIEKCFAAAVLIVTEEKALMDRLSDVLMSNETVLKDEWETMRKEHSVGVNIAKLGLPGWEAGE